MMTIEQLSRLKSWFTDYTRSFLTGDALSDGPLVLKMDHTTRVCDNMRLLAGSIDLPDDAVRLAEAIGWFHDLGRFEQFRRFHTFNDRRSVNHATLGVDLLMQHGVLHELASGTHGLITDAVGFHNAPVLPPGKATGSVLFMRMIRDADKLDIWKIFADCFRGDRSPDSTVVQHLPDQPIHTPAIIEAISRERVARFQDMKSLDDFKLLQLSWVFELNFTETLIQTVKRGELTAIAASLPDVPAVTRAVDIVMHRLDRMVQNSPRR